MTVVADYRNPGNAVADRAAPSHLECRESDLHSVVASAAVGNADAWEILTRRFGRMVLAIARSCRLSDADAAEVHQTTWLRLVENIDRIEQPERIGGWLATTARRESLRIVRGKARLSLDNDTLDRLPDLNSKPLDAGPLADERAEAVRRAFTLLPAHCRLLLGVLMGDDTPSYKEIANALAMPIGSIGPTRGRCLEHLRRIMDELGASV